MEVGEEGEYIYTYTDTVTVTSSLTSPNDFCGIKMPGAAMGAVLTVSF